MSAARIKLRNGALPRTVSRLPQAGRGNRRVAQLGRSDNRSQIMCGRYVSPDDAAIEREFSLVRSSGLDILPSYNVAPSQIAPVVRSINGVRQVSLMRWGLV